MWELLGALVSKPVYLVLITVMCFVGWQYVSIERLQAKLVKKEAEIVELNTKIDLCVKNEGTVTEGIDKCNQAIADLKKNNEMLTKKWEDEKKRVAEWKKKYEDKKCFNNTDETAKPNTTGAVLNDGKSNEAVNSINSIYLRFGK